VLVLDWQIPVDSEFGAGAFAAIDGGYTYDRSFR
jgi:hypothetical protein